VHWSHNRGIRPASVGRTGARRQGRAPLGSPTYRKHTCWPARPRSSARNCSNLSTRISPNSRGTLKRSRRPTSRLWSCSGRSQAWTGSWPPSWGADPLMISIRGQKSRGRLIIGWCRLESCNIVSMLGGSKSPFGDRRTAPAFFILLIFLWEQAGCRRSRGELHDAAMPPADSLEALAEKTGEGMAPDHAKVGDSDTGGNDWDAVSRQDGLASEADPCFVNNPPYPPIPVCCGQVAETNCYPREFIENNLANCVKEGDSFNGRFLSFGIRCCEGLVMIETQQTTDAASQDSSSLSGCDWAPGPPGHKICARCGDGICGPGENQCNCSVDCTMS
jgi:hypothetical protein